MTFNPNATPFVPASVSTSALNPNATPFTPREKVENTKWRGGSLLRRTHPHLFEDQAQEVPTRMGFVQSRPFLRIKEYERPSTPNPVDPESGEIVYMTPSGQKVILSDKILNISEDLVPTQIIHEY